jgi:hypothetical protein
VRLKNSTLVNWLVLLFPLISVGGCKTVDPIYVTEIEVVTRDRYVSFPKKFTEPVKPAKLPSDFGNMSEGAAAKALGVAWRQQEELFGQCNNKLAAIEFVSGTLVPSTGE